MSVTSLTHKLKHIVSMLSMSVCVCVNVGALIPATFPYVCLFIYKSWNECACICVGVNPHILVLEWETQCVMLSSLCFIVQSILMNRGVLPLSGPATSVMLRAICAIGLRSHAYYISCLQEFSTFTFKSLMYLL